MANIRATFSINAAGTVWGAIEGSLANQTDLANALNAKQNVITDLDTIRLNAENGNSAYQTIGTYGDIVTYNASDFATATQGGLADSALQPNDNITELVNNAGYITSASVGNGTLTIQKNSTDVGTFSANQSANKTINITVPTQASDINALPDTTTINDLTSTEQQAALNSGATSTNIGQIATNTGAISTINGKIPSAASTTNQLADKQFVNNAIQTNSAHFRGNWATWSAVPTNSADYPADDDGNKTPTTNDYIVVEDASGYTEETLEGAWQFTYTGTWATNGKNGWLPRFQINESPLTPAQLAALNSGATITNIGQITTNQNAIGTISSLTTSVKTDLVSAINELDSDKQDNITDLSTIRSGAELGATSIQPGDNISELVNNSGYITGITSSDVTTALGYTPYDNSNPAGYTTNVGTVTSVNNNSPDANGNVSITIPTVNNATLTIQKNGTTVNTFTANASSNVTANITVPTDVSDLTNTTLANTDLGNLSETGDNRLHALKGYSDNGEYLYDAEGLSDVKNYAHSTFDASKFTKVGSPNITDDGIASGFSNDNYIRNTNAIVKPYTFEVDMVVDYPTDSWGSASSTTLCDIYKNNSNYIRLKIIKSNQTINIDKSINGVVGTYSSNSNVVSLGAKNVRLQWGYNGTNYYIKQNGITLVDEVGTWISEDITYDLGIGRDLFVDNWQFLGSFDLKQFSITVDGVPVFSGNKTGIDIVKDNDYTVVGTPTISDDGVASGFSSGNYIYANDITDLGTKPFKIITYFNYAGSETTLWQISGGGYTNYLKINSNGKIILYLAVGSSSTVMKNFEYALPSQGNYTHIFEFTGTQYKFEVYQNDTLLGSVSYDSTSSIYPNTTTQINIGYSAYAGYLVSGSIDLNAFKIYVDGNLVYQPCLRIPYTESSVNSGRVVNYIYRDRVLDAYNQYGSYNSYTLQEDNVPNYTVVGSPTISSDFVASGFSSSNYLTISANIIDKLVNATNFNYIFRFKTGNSLGSGGLVIGYNNAISGGTFSLWVSASSVAPIIFLNESGTATLNAVGNITKTINTNTEYEAYFSKNGNNYGFGIKALSEETYTTSSGITSANPIYANTQTVGRISILESIDLKTVEIVADNKLTYQAVIPPNFTLPCGDVYGLIGQRTLVDSHWYSDGSYWELWSDRTLEIGGTCESGVEYNLPRPFASNVDLNTIPCSAKTASSFTPSATGDFIAKGRGIL